MYIENINNTNFIKVNDTATQIQLKIFDNLSNPFDLKSASRVVVVIGNYIGRTLTKIPDLLDDTGVLEFGLDDGDLLEVGDNLLEVHIIMPNGEKFVAPSSGYYKLKVQRSIDRLGEEVTTVTLEYFLREANQVLDKMNTKVEYVNQTAEDLRQDVSDNLNSLEESVNQTANDLRQEVATAIQYVDGTAEGLRQEVSDNLDALEGYVIQTANDLQREVATAIQYVDGTAEGLRQEVSDNLDALEGYVIQTANDLQREVATAIQYVDDTTEDLRQEVSENLDSLVSQEVDNKMTPFMEVVNKHLTDDVSKGEVHGLRVTRGKLMYFDGQEWQGVKGGYNVYGLEWNQTLDTYQRLEDAVGMVAITQGQNDFDNVYPWSEMKRCNLDDNGNVLAYFGDPTFKDGGSNGQVMVQIPKFWYKSEMVNENGQKKYRWWIANKELKDFKLHPAFVRNGVEKDFIYIGAYEGHENGGKLHSIAGVTPRRNRTIVQFRDLAQARGSIWHQQDFLTICAIQLLYLIEYAHFDSQTKIGQGITSDSIYLQTGETVQYGNQSYGDPDNATVAMSYRGIENLYGHFYKWVDGINLLDRQVYVADHSFESDKFDGHYENFGIVLPNANGFVKDIHHTQMFDYGFLSSDSTGSSASYIPDQQYTNYAGARVTIFGGGRENGSNAGAFCWNIVYSSSQSYSVVGARLLCIP